MTFVIVLLISIALVWVIRAVNEARNAAKSQRDLDAEESLYEGLTLGQRCAIMFLYTIYAGDPTSESRDFDKAFKAAEILNRASFRLGITPKDALDYFVPLKGRGLEKEMCSIRNKVLLHLLMVDYLCLIKLNDNDTKEMVEKGDQLDYLCNKLGFTEEEKMNIIDKVEIIMRSI